MGDVLLNVADILNRSRSNGPGLRSVVWVQGCTIKCPGCFNPHTHCHEPVKLLDPDELGRKLLGIPDTEGITVFGGEPFEQAEACAILLDTYRATGRSAMVYSGYPYKALRASPLSAVRHMLRSIDLLVAGPFVKNLHGQGTMWRGSSNQTLHFLTGRMTDAMTRVSPDAPLVEIASDGKDVSSTGFPDNQDRIWLDRVLEHVAGREAHITAGGLNS